MIYHDFKLSVCEKHMCNCQIPNVRRHTFTYHLEEITVTLWWIDRNDLWLEFELSLDERDLWRGLGVEISLPHCLATGIWTLAPKAITRSKSRGTIVRYDALAPRPELLRSISPFYGTNQCSEDVLSALFCADTVFLKLSYSTLSKTETDYFAFLLKCCHLSRIWCFLE